MKSLWIDRIGSPIGEILIVGDGEKLCALDFADTEHRMLRLLDRRYGAVRFLPMPDPRGISGRIRAYFAGDYASLDAIPVSLAGTPFQESVWRGLSGIPRGTVLTYGELAASLGCPMAYRAVGAANARNPIGIVVPCHRLVGADASLTGYSGGLERKRWLLHHEGVDLGPRDDWRRGHQSSLGRGSIVI